MTDYCGGDYPRRILMRDSESRGVLLSVFDIFTSDFAFE